jgi:hypothetical protein
MKYDELKEIDSELLNLKNKITDLQSKIDKNTINPGDGCGFGGGKESNDDRKFYIQTLISNRDSLYLEFSITCSRKASYMVQKTADSSRKAAWGASLAAAISAIAPIMLHHICHM